MSHILVVILFLINITTHCCSVSNRSSLRALPLFMRRTTKPDAYPFNGVSFGYFHSRSIDSSPCTYVGFMILSRSLLPSSLRYICFFILSVLLFLHLILRFFLAFLFVYLFQAVPSNLKFTLNSHYSMSPVVQVTGKGKVIPLQSRCGPEGG